MQCRLSPQNNIPRGSRRRSSRGPIAADESIGEFGGNPPHAPHANKVHLYTPEILIRTRKTTQNSGNKRQLALLELTYISQKRPFVL